MLSYSVYNFYLEEGPTVAGTIVYQLVINEILINQKTNDGIKAINGLICFMHCVFFHFHLYTRIEKKKSFVVVI